MTSRWSRRGEPDFSVGYEVFLTEARESILLPIDVARQVRYARSQAELHATADKTTGVDVEARICSEKPRKSRKSNPADARVGQGKRAQRHCVFPRMEDLLQDKINRSFGKSSDKDVVERQERLFARLSQLGPYRRVASPASWRQAVVDLEATLPHFRAPLQSVRNALALAELTGTAPKIGPMLLLGPPGIGKTHFAHQLATLLGSPFGAVHFDQPTAGSQLRGSDKYWSNSEPGLLFNLICLGTCANPVVLLDELDKSCAASTVRDIDPLAQLHAALETETSRRLVDISVDIEFDASLVTYIATANSIARIGHPILSRMQVFEVAAPSAGEGLVFAKHIVDQTLARLRLDRQFVVDRGAMMVLACMSPRLVVRTIEQAAGECAFTGRSRISESDIWAVLGEPRQIADPH